MPIFLLFNTQNSIPQFLGQNPPILTRATGPVLPGLSPPFWLCSTLFSTHLLFLHQPHLLGRGALTHCPAFPANSYSSTGVQLKCPRESLPVSTILRGLCFPSESSPSWVGSFNLVSPTGLSLLENKGFECFTLLSLTRGLAPDQRDRQTWEGNKRQQYCSTGL